MPKQLKDIRFPVYRIPRGEITLTEAGWRIIGTAQGTKLIHPPIVDNNAIMSRVLYNIEHCDRTVAWCHLEPVLHYSGLFEKSARYLTTEGKVFEYNKNTSFDMKSCKITEHGACRSAGFYVQVLGYSCRFHTTVPPEAAMAYASIIITLNGPILYALSATQQKATRKVL